MKQKLIMLLVVCSIPLSLGRAQTRAIGAKQLILDDGQGHTITVQTPVPTTTGTLTLPSGGGVVTSTASGTVTGQILRWNNVSNQWEVSPSVTNVGSTLSNSGPINATGGSGTITASGNISSSGGSVSASTNVSAGSYVQAGGALGASTPVSGAHYADNMIQAAGKTDINGQPYIKVGNYSVVRNSTGNYTMTFAYNVATDPVVIATNANVIGAYIINRTPLQIQVLEFFPDGTTPVDGGFDFIVLGQHL